MSNALVSAIIPAFNREKTIERAVASALQQTHREVEVLIVDDASKDHTVERVEQIRDSRVRLIQLESNGGVSVARNTGVTAAKGEYVAFLDSDDWWSPSKLTQQLQAVAGCQSSRVLCSHPFLMREDGVTRTWPKRGPHPGEPIADYMFAQNGNLQTSTWFMPRALALEFPFNPVMRRHEDWDVLLRMNAAGVSFQYIDEPLTSREIEHADRLSGVQDAQFSEQFLHERAGLLGRRAAAAYRARIVAPQLHNAGEPLRAAAMVGRGYLDRGLSSGAALKLALRVFAPALQQALLRARTRIKGENP